MTARVGITSFLLLIFLVQRVENARFAFTRKGQSQPCIVMDATFFLRINAVRHKRVVTTDILDSKDHVIDISGSCGESRAVLNLGFRGGVMWSFIFRDHEDIVSLNRLIQFTPKKIFAKYVTNISSPLTFDDPNTISLSRANESFVCVSKEITDYFPIKSVQGDTTFSIQTQTEKVRAQAFGLKGGEYSSPVLCHDDLANLSTPTTTTQVTTTPIVVPSYVYYAKTPQNTDLCIALTGRIDIDITYEYNTTDGIVQTRNATFAVPDGAKSYGNCSLNDDTQNLIVEFFQPSWTLEFIFKKNFGYGKSQGKLDYSIQSINLVYVNDAEKFPNSVLPDNTTVRENSIVQEPHYPHKSTGKGFYSCLSRETMRINKNAAITTSALQFKAFNADTVWYFKGKSSKCQADIKSDTKRGSPVVAVVVIICVLVIVGIIFVIAMICKKRRRRRRYKPIRGRKIF